MVWNKRLVLLLFSLLYAQQLQQIPVKEVKVYKNGVAEVLREGTITLQDRTARILLPPEAEIATLKVATTTPKVEIIEVSLPWTPYYTNIAQLLFQSVGEEIEVDYLLTPQESDIIRGILLYVDTSTTQPVIALQLKQPPAMMLIPLNRILTAKRLGEHPSSITPQVLIRTDKDVANLRVQMRYRSNLWEWKSLEDYRLRNEQVEVIQYATLVYRGTNPINMATYHLFDFPYEQRHLSDSAACIHTTAFEGPERKQLFCQVKTIPCKRIYYYYLEPIFSIHWLPQDTLVYQQEPLISYRLQCPYIGETKEVPTDQGVAIVRNEAFSKKSEEVRLEKQLYRKHLVEERIEIQNPSEEPITLRIYKRIEGALSTAPVAKIEDRKPLDQWHHSYLFYWDKKVEPKQTITLLFSYWLYEPLLSHD